MSSLYTTIIIQGIHNSNNKIITFFASTQAKLQIYKVYDELSILLL